MNQDKLKNYLEISSNVAVLLVAIVVLGTFALTYFVPQQTPNLVTGLKKGQTLAELPNIDYETSTHTLLLALNTKCSYCKASSPFYQRLVKAHRDRGQNTRIIAVFPNTNEEVSRYTQENQLGVETFAQVDFKTLELIGTPTIILLNGKGQVQEFWVGKIPENEEARIIETMLGEDL